MKNLIFEMKKNAGLYEDEQILNEGLFGPSTDAKVANLVNLIKNTSLKTSDSIAVQEKNELLGQIKTYGSKVAELLKQDPKNKQAATWIDKAYSEADALHKGSFTDSQKK